MSMNDTISDMLTRIRNGMQVQRAHVDVIGSRVNKSIAQAMRREGFIHDVNEVLDPRGHPALRVGLKYDDDGVPVISRIGRVSKPGRRVYCGVRDIPRVLNGLGISVVSTSQGVLSDREARTAGVGGEILCEMW